MRPRLRAGDWTAAAPALIAGLLLLPLAAALAALLVAAFGLWAPLGARAGAAAICTARGCSEVRSISWSAWARASSSTMVT